MKLPKLETIEMMKCDSCGQYHPIAECEIVTIKIIKGKSCVMNSNNAGIASKNLTSSAKPTTLANPNKVIIEGEDMGVPLYEVKNTESAQGAQGAQRKSIVPPAFAGVFIPQDSPDFEARGAKEIRRI